jgi:histidinol dehydrogenase
VVLVDDLEQAADFSNAFGPEHLEIQVRDGRRRARRASRTPARSSSGRTRP